MEYVLLAAVEDADGGLLRELLQADGAYLGLIYFGPERLGMSLLDFLFVIRSILAFEFACDESNDDFEE